MSLSTFFRRQITNDESKDTGMAMVLLLLISFFFLKRESLLVAATAVHVVNMAIPQVFRPLAVVWLGLSHLLGNIVSTVLLSVVFILVVTPVGIVRKWLKMDPMHLRSFRANDRSVMLERNHTFTAGDLEKPY